MLLKMAIDGIFLRHMLKEIIETAKGGRITQIYQPAKDELLLVFRTTGQGNKKLLLSAKADAARIQFTESAPENPKVPPMLCMLLRKKLGGGKLLDIRQPDLERILFFDFESVNEIGDRVFYVLAVEIMGKHSNIILFDKDGIIVDSLKRVDLTISSQRLVLPNLRYSLPPPQDKISVLSHDENDIIRLLLADGNESELSRVLMKHVQGISPVIAREIQYKAAVSDIENECPLFITNRNLSDTQRERLKDALKCLILTCRGISGRPIGLSHKAGSFFDMSFMNISQYGHTAEIHTFNSFSNMLDAFYSERAQAQRIRQQSSDLYKLISNLTERISKKINLQKSDLKKCADREELRMKGDLVSAYIHKISRGDTFVDVENFYDENNALLRIELNPALSPGQNAQKFYKNYRKAKTAEQMLTQQIEKAAEELKYIDAVFYSLKNAKNISELEQIRYELMEQGYIKQQKNKQKQQQSFVPLSYKSSDGFRILVGRNNKQNDFLTLKQSNKNDIWFHTKDISGSHTVLVTEGRDVSETAMKEAAQLAAYYSSARESSKVPVDYTQIRYVSKPKGSKPGMVIYINQKTIYAEPKEAVTI